MPPNEENVGPLWPELPYADWKDTYATLHLWTQIVGKIRLKQSPWLNHSWHVVLYVSPRGLTTSSIPYGNRTFQLDFDFLDHVLLASTSDGAQREIRLIPRSVADFYADLLHSLSDTGIEVPINELPNEIPDAIPFSQDHIHASYDKDFAQRFWRILVQSERVLSRFRTSFIGKCSPVHFCQEEACPIFPRRWCGTHIRMRSAARGFGLEGKGLSTRRIIPTRRRRPRASRRLRYALPRLSGAWG